jgi:hypothetical protein
MICSASASDLYEMMHATSIGAATMLRHDVLTGLT